MQSGGDGGDEHRLYVQSKVLHHGKQPGHCQMSDSAVRHLWAPKSLVEIRASGTLMKLPVISIDQCNYDSATLDNCTNSFVPSLFICKARHILHLDEPLFLIYGIYPSELMQVRRPHLGPGPCDAIANSASSQDRPMSHAMHDPCRWHWVLELSANRSSQATSQVVPFTSLTWRQWSLAQTGSRTLLIRVRSFLPLSCENAQGR